MKTKLFRRIWDEGCGAIVWKCCLCQADRISFLVDTIDHALHHLRFMHKAKGYLIVSLPGENIYADSELRIGVPPDQIKGLRRKKNGKNT